MHHNYGTLLASGLSWPKRFLVEYVIINLKSDLCVLILG